MYQFVSNININVPIISEKEKPGYLSEFIRMPRANFTNELIIFGNDIIQEFYKNKKKYFISKNIYDTETLTHHTMFNYANDLCNNIKSLIDYAWHCNPIEPYCETVAKELALNYCGNKERTLFDKLKTKALNKCLYPGKKDEDKLVDDISRQCVVDGIRSIKTDRRAKRYSIVLHNRTNKVDNKVPYG